MIDKNQFEWDIKTKTEMFPHFWEHTIGSGHATLALRADWQKQLKRCHDELGFKHVRFHGILSDDMGTLVDEEDQFVYSFFNADQVMDFLLSAGIRPFVELSFMPGALASGKKTVFHYHSNVTPPKDYSKWETLIFKLVKHWAERYGLDEVREWFFEVWNEPNLKSFWTGSQKDYFTLYKHTVKAIKKIDKQLRTGGPATAKNEWIKEFIDFCKKEKLPVDFISTHHYPTDAFGKPGDDTEAQLAESKRSVLQKEAATTKQEAGNLPVYYTEWSTSSNPFDKLHDQAYASAFITKTIMEARGFVKGYSYWTFSDIFEENYFSSKPFHGGFGLLNIYGIPKPAYRAYQLLHDLGEEIFAQKFSDKTIDAWLIKKENDFQLLITNSALPEHRVKTETVFLHLKNFPKKYTGKIQRVDDTHANAYCQWQNMGKPESLSPKDVRKIEESSALITEEIDLTFSENMISFEVEMPPQGIALITLMMYDK